MPLLRSHYAIRLVVLLVLALPPAAFAQQRPLVTEDPETVGAGNVLIEGGFDYSWDNEFPVSGLSGDLLRLPLLGFSVGVSSIAEIQLDGGFHNHLWISERDPSAPLAGIVTATGDSTGDVEDAVIGTKVRFLPEGMRRPAFAFRFATRLPNANNETGLGRDTTDFYATLIAGKTVRSVRVVANGGLGILGDPVDGNRQNDVFLYGVSFARALTNQAEVVGEINGWINTRNGEPPAGTDSRGIVRLGARYTIGSWRADGGILFGVTPNDPSFGFIGGATYVFNAFRVPLMTRVAKGHAYGNDFLLAALDEARRDSDDAGALARAMCHRHHGIGADGLILFDVRQQGATMTLFNADGSPSELSGNGLRCLAALIAREQRLPTGSTITVETGAGTKALELLATAGQRYSFRAALGIPTDIREVTIPVLGESVRATTLGMGNPQCVVLGALPDADRFNRLGPALSTHAMFPAGTNVEFAHVESLDRVRIVIWERGVGPTTSSGTGSSASAVAAAAHGGAARDVQVIAPGGTQRVEWREDGVYLTGWAELVLEGTWL